MGKSTGVVTNVTITHATPSAYLAHINKRNERKIAEQYLENSNFDLVLGGGLGYFLPSTEKNSKRNDNLNLLERLYQNNFNVALNKEDLIKVSTEYKRIVGMFATEDLPYRIDRSFYPNTIPTIVDMTKHAIQFLSKNENGFFLMVESGKIDWAMHSHDAGTAIQEIADLQEAYQVALDFLAKNPDTLIIVTADHETSGCALGIGKDLNLKKFEKQKASAAYIANLINNKSEKEIKNIIHQFTPLKKIPKKAMKKLLQKTDSKEWYSPKKTETITKLIAKKAHIGFTTPNHSGQSVGVYARGAGHNMFSGVYENSEIVKKILQLLQYKKGE
jgi:alkaline phosphatase